MSRQPEIWDLPPDQWPLLDLDLRLQHVQDEHDPAVEAWEWTDGPTVDLPVNRPLGNSLSVAEPVVGDIVAPSFVGSHSHGAGQSERAPAFASTAADQQVILGSSSKRKLAEDMETADLKPMRARTSLVDVTCD